MSETEQIDHGFVGITCTANPQRGPHETGDLIVRLLGAAGDGFGEVGRRAEGVYRELGIEPTQGAWDFLTIAFAVTAADHIVARKRSADSWTRQIRLSVELGDPRPWRAEIAQLESLLGFLSGDIWQLSFRDRGLVAPSVARRPRAADCVCLFSGGLDSYVGVIDLVAEGRCPLLVSHAYKKDDAVQKQLSKLVGMLPPRPPLRLLQFDADPRHPLTVATDASMRTRSLLFLGGAVAAASSCAVGGPATVFVPENGFIALNPPLTYRRLGSLSTRTTHPYFLRNLEDLLRRTGVDVRLTNPYELRTKGEMLAECRRPYILLRHGSTTVSCGKSARINGQCGRCVPCVIRRAAFAHAGVPDQTPYGHADLAAQRDWDDVCAFGTAIERVRTESVAYWLMSSAPLPPGSDRRAMSGVVERGLREVQSFLNAQLQHDGPPLSPGSVSDASSRH